MDSAKIISDGADEGNFDRKRDFNILNTAIDSFNNTALELEHSYRVLCEQVAALNRELEEKNRQLEKNLYEKERVKNFLSSILDSSPTGVVVTDLTGRMLMCNSAVEKITDACPTRMKGHQLKEWLENMGIMDSFSGSPDRNRVHEVEFVRKNREVRNLKVFQSPVVGTFGETIGILFNIQDQTRLKKLEGQSERDKRLKAMGEMAIKIAHEVRNPLGSIELLASILRKELESQDDLRRMSDRIITEVKSLDNTISNLLLFTRPQQPILHEVNLSNFLSEFVDFIQPVLGKNGIDLNYAPCKTPCLISGDRDLLKQIFLNLTLNAIQAMPEGGRIGIDVHSFREEEDRSSRWVEVSFSDNGQGIACDALNNVFHPFYTTKEKGTGLGLAIVHNIVESHNATIEVRSKPGRGTAFLISFPFRKA